MSDAALTISEEPPQRVQATAATPYDAFISYSHAKDKALASGLQSAMQRLGKPWYRRRALRLFRDDTSLTATPHLWPSIEKALGQSRFLILMASPDAAASHWVNQELAWWLDHNGPDTVLIALTAGELEWSGEAGDFRASDATPLPPALRGRFADEPLWIDLRPYREAASPRDARFTDLAASIAAALHGRPKEDLLSQEVRQQRRALRLASSAVALLLLLLGLAGWQWNAARTQRNRAEHNLALATATANELVFDLVQKFRDLGVPAAVSADILQRVRKLQQQLASAGEGAADLRRSEAAALDETALNLLNSGDTKGALAAASKARDIARALVAGAPENPDYQRDLAVTQKRLGDILQRQGDLAGALAGYREAKAIDEALVRKDAANDVWQIDLSGDDSDIGDILSAQVDNEGALAAYRDAVAIAKAVVQRAGPERTGWQLELSSREAKLGDALMQQRDLTGALAAYRDAQEIRKALTQRVPGNTQVQRDLAVIGDEVASVLAAQGDTAGALALYREDLAIRQALAQQDPANTEWQLDLWNSNISLGNLLSSQRSNAGAILYYRQAVAIIRLLSQKDSNNVQWQVRLALSLGILAESGDSPKANLSAALAILTPLEAASQLSAYDKQLMASLQADLARLGR